MSEECPMCQDPFGGQAALMSQLIEWVELKNDIMIIAVQDDIPFSYTIGMERNFNTPEMIVFGLPARNAKGIFNTTKDRIKDGLKLEYNTRIPKIARGFDVVFKEFSEDQDHPTLILARWYYRDNSFRTIQCFWPDKANIFPWEEGFDENLKDLQPNV